MLEDVVQQADNLIARGMSGNRDEMASRLAVVSAHRLAEYWEPFVGADGRFVEGATFDRVWARYAFDRRLRLLLFDAIERIEVCLKSQLIVYLGNNNDISKMTFGAARRCFEAASATEVKTPIAKVFGVHHVVLSSWLESLLLLRNVVAHHGRVWNRQIGAQPKIPKKDAAWHTPVELSGDRVFVLLTICRHCLRKIAPQSSWQNRLETLLADYPEVPLAAMGFPADWQSLALWK